MARLVVVALLFAAPAHAGPYEDCILENMKGVQAQTAAVAVLRACRDKTTPKMCRDDVLKLERSTATGVWIDLDAPRPSKPKPWTPQRRKESGPTNFFDRFDIAGAQQAGYSDQEILAFAREQCINECATTSWWSRTFGECATD